MRSFTDNEIEDYLKKHFPHRLTLLRTLSNRNRHGWRNEGDIYRCVKDSCLMAIRFWINFLGFKINREGSLVLIDQQNTKPDDVSIYSFTNQWVPMTDPLISENKILLERVYKRGDKEIAHFTTNDDGEYNTEEKLIEATKVVEELISERLYKPLGKSIPRHDECC